MRQLLPLAAAAITLLGAAPVASAAVQMGEYFSFSGFGTLGAVQTDSDEGKFGRDRQIGGADRDVSFDPDSNFGVQLTGTATGWLSATVQVLAAKRDKGHVEPKIEWAFVTVKPLDGLSLRGGRMAAPVFAISDSRNIGYANTWVRAPNEVYALNVFRNLDGVDVTYRKSFGPASVSATGFGGTSKFRSLTGVFADCDKVRGLNLQVESEWATLRLGQATTDVVIPLPGVAPDPYKFTGIGVVVDRENIVAQAEFVKRRSERQAANVNADGWYLMGGYRFGTVLPYAIVSRTLPKTPTAAGLLSAKQKTTAIGVRWDAFASAAIKVQLDYIDTEETKGISFTTPLTTPRPPARPVSRPVTQPVTALSIAVDFAF